MAALAAVPLSTTTTKRTSRRPKTAPASTCAYSSRVVPPTMIPDHAFRTTPPSTSTATFGSPQLGGALTRSVTSTSTRPKRRDDDGNDADDDDDRRLPLAPRAPKRNDYFLVDLSFLEEEPTFLRGSRSSGSQRRHEVRPSSFRRISGASDGSLNSSRTWKESYADLLRDGDGASLSTLRGSEESSPVRLTFPNASRPFPSRPRSRPANEGHRSSSSGEAGELVFAGSKLHESDEALQEMSATSHTRHRSIDDNGESLDRRRRMARVLLDKTAAAMEGGKSLAMAKEHLIRTAAPEVDPEAHLVSNELAAAEKRAKRAEKRRRTILELCETEASYASDMSVVRDIFLERAKGVDLGVIADRVIASGLGLKGVPSPTSATFPPTSPLAGGISSRRQSSASTTSSLVPPTRRRHRPSSADSDRRISAQSFAEKLEKRRATMNSSSGPAVPAGSHAPLSPKDVHIIFANLEQITDLAQAFAGVLEGAKGTDEVTDDDRIGEVFVEMIPRLQDVYSIYCARHHRAILRLQELEPELRAYLQECEHLCHGRTALPNLSALLIKPVQRCLKYPLLLDQILALTPDDHPDRDALRRANADALAMAEHINEYKKRSETVDRVVNNRPVSSRRDSSRSISSTVSKKFMRSTHKAKTAIGLGDLGERDDMFDTLATLVESTKGAVVRFSTEMKDWSRTSKLALDSQVTLVEGWIKLYAPIGSEMESPSYERLVVFQDEVLLPLIEGPWKELDHEIRNSLILKTDHLLSLFDNPSRVIAKRNDKQVDHIRYVKRKDPADRRGSEEFQLLTAQLLEELPRFLGSVSRYFNIVVNHFGGAQAAYNEALQERWDAYADVWLNQIPAGRSQQIQEAFERQHLRIDEMMRTLATGLGISHSPPTPPKRSTASSARHSRHSSHGSTQQSSGSPVTSPASVSSPTFSSPPSMPSMPPSAYQAGFKNYTFGATPRARPSKHTPRLSIDSEASVAYTNSHRSSTWTTATVSTTASSIPEVPTPPMTQAKDTTEDAQDSQVNHNPRNALRRPSYHSKQSIDSLERRLSFVSELARAAAEGDRPTEFWRRRSSTASGLISAYVDDDEEDGELAEVEEGDTSVSGLVKRSSRADSDDAGEALYRAEAMRGAKSIAFRSGYAILSFEAGDEIDVLVEEADRAEGGAGWLLARKVLTGEVGWARTEDFAIAE
ncbi:hypothetical protein OIO90_001345 [Microbotryomycetes sp. JL221]|nr:hypothetical protein OIO90_001345 [Microbotryomycetes sp. JL221]